MKEKALIQDFTHGKILPQLLRFGTPFILSQLLQTVYNLVDMVVVGQVLGSSGLSAVSTGGELLHVFTFVCMGLTTAGQVLIAQLVGRKDLGGLNRFIGTLFSLMILLALGFSAIGLGFTDQLMSLMNVPPEAYDYAKDYMTVCCTGMFFIYGYNVVSGVLQGMGDSKHPFYFIAIASVTNLILDVVFVAGLGWGVFGAALATVMGQGLSFLISITYLFRNKESFGFDFRLGSFRLRKEHLIPLLKLGFPMCMQFCAINLSNLYINASVNSYGVVCAAVSGVGGKLNSVLSVVCASMISAGSTMIGQNFGAGKVDRIRKVFFSIMTITTAFALIMSAVVLSIPELVFGIFSQDASVLAMAAVYAPVSALSFLGAGLRASSIAFINGSGATRMNFVMGIMDGFVIRIGLAWIMNSLIGITGLWYGSAIAGFTFFVVGLPYFLSGVWKKRLPQCI